MLFCEGEGGLCILLNTRGGWLGVKMVENPLVMGPYDPFQCAELKKVGMIEKCKR